jgi:ribonuclease P protein component
MLAKKYKLKSNSEISQVFKNGKTVKSSFLFLRYRFNNSDHPRIAFSIGLKYSKKAVDRNYAKRILRASADSLVNEIKPNCDLVFYFNKSFQEKLNFQETKEAMRSCLLKANLLK